MREKKTLSLFLCFYLISLCSFSVCLRAQSLWLLVYIFDVSSMFYQRTHTHTQALKCSRCSSRQRWQSADNNLSHYVDRTPLIILMDETRSHTSQFTINLVRVRVHYNTCWCWIFMKIVAPVHPDNVIHLLQNRYKCNPFIEICTPTILASLHLAATLHWLHIHYIRQRRRRRRQWRRQPGNSMCNLYRKSIYIISLTDTHPRNGIN